MLLRSKTDLGIDETQFMQTAAKIISGLLQIFPMLQQIADQIKLADAERRMTAVVGKQTFIEVLKTH